MPQHPDRVTPHLAVADAVRVVVHVGLAQRVGGARRAVVAVVELPLVLVVVVRRAVAVPKVVVRVVLVFVRVRGREAAAWERRRLGQRCRAALRVQTTEAARRREARRRGGG